MTKHIHLKKGGGLLVWSGDPESLVGQRVNRVRKTEEGFRGRCQKRVDAATDGESVALW